MLNVSVRMAKKVSTAIRFNCAIATLASVDDTVAFHQYELKKATKKKRKKKTEKYCVCKKERRRKKEKKIV